MGKETKREKKEQTLDSSTAKSKIRSFFYNFSSNISSIRYILIWYVLISLFGTILLYLPISHRSGKWDVSFIDALFMSSSSFSDTGLSTLSVYDTFNYFGKLVTLILLNIGGVGLFTIKIFILKYIFRKKITLSEISDGSAEVGANNKTETLGLIFSSIIISLFSTIFFGLIFGILFATVKENSILSDGLIESNLYGNWLDSMMTGFYHASASVNNSGLDVFKGNTSMSAYSGNIVIQLMTMSLFIIGGIGFGVFYDVYKYIVSKKTGQAFSFSLITKISVSAYAVIALSGLLLVYLSEGLSTINNPDAFLNGDHQGYRAWALAFNTFSTRNAGFSTIDLSDLNHSTTMIQGLMMFIGSGPGSTAGGLRTTTTAVIAFGAWSYIRGNKKSHMFNRAIPESTIKAAFIILISSLVLIFTGVLIISMAETLSSNNVSILDITFLMLSSYGTTGLSTMDLAHVTFATKFVIIVTMFIGQLGMSTSLLQLRKKKLNEKIFVEEKVSLG